MIPLVFDFGMPRKVACFVQHALGAAGKCEDGNGTAGVKGEMQVLTLTCRDFNDARVLDCGSPSDCHKTSIVQNSPCGACQASLVASVSGTSLSRWTAQPARCTP